MKLTSHIEMNPKIMLGKPIIRGTRITVELILRKLSEGATEAELIAAYPQLTPKDVRAAIAYAAETLAHEEAFFYSRLSVIRLADHAAALSIPHIAWAPVSSGTQATCQRLAPHQAFARRKRSSPSRSRSSFLTVGTFSAIAAMASSAMPEAFWMRNVSTSVCGSRLPQVVTQPR
jgi:uncharacterized protein (DUF433 family)